MLLVGLNRKINVVVINLSNDSKNKRERREKREKKATLFEKRKK